MNKYYLTDKNISEKTDKWLSNLNIPQKRIKKFEFSTKKSALLVIDMQDFFVNKKSHAFIPSTITIIPRINKLIDYYRKHNSPIIFTYHAYQKNEKPGIMKKWWGDVLTTDNPLAKISSLINYRITDIIIQKKRYSAFIGTNLQQILCDKKIEKLVITGTLTHLCCESTARDAFMKDYEVYFVIDATVSDTEDLHISSLKTLTDGFVIPVKTETILKEVKHS